MQSQGACYAPLCAQPLAAATADLLPETIAATPQHGQSLDLHETVTALLAYLDSTT